MSEKIIDRIFKLINTSKHINGKEPVLFMCNRRISDALKAEAAKSGSPVTVEYVNHVLRLYVFGIPFYLTEDFELEPFLISTKAHAAKYIF